MLRPVSASSSPGLRLAQSISCPVLSGDVTSQMPLTETGTPAPGPASCPALHLTTLCDHARQLGLVVLPRGLHRLQLAHSQHALRQHPPKYDVLVVQPLCKESAWFERAGPRTVRAHAAAGNGG